MSEREQRMKAIAVTPGAPGSLRVVEQQAPVPADGEVLLKVLRVGICGTDRDIVQGFYGEAPAGSDLLVLGHESLCRVAGVGRSVEGFAEGDLVVPTVRRDCPEECLNCSSGESDMCLTGHYREHGIKGLHGFAREYATSDSRFVAHMPEALSEVGVLLEPLTIVEKGLRQTMSMQRARMKWEPKSALVLGAGPVGQLATALLVLEGFEVSTVATRPRDSLKAKLVNGTGAEYVDAKETPLSTLEHRFDLVLELTGNAGVALEAQALTGVNGIVSYLGIYKEGQRTEDAGRIFTSLVLGNRVFFGSVNANLTYFRKGVDDLVRIKERWPGFLKSLITRNFGPEDAARAYASESEEDIKTTVSFG
jgi:glucose 1-dehydrogenase